jgi:hypothetical protein
MTTVRWNRLHPTDVARVPHVTQVLDLLLRFSWQPVDPAMVGLT